MPKYENRDFPTKTKATEFISTKGLSLRKCSAIPNEKDLQVNECFLIQVPVHEKSFEGAYKWEVIFRLPDEPYKLPIPNR